MSYLKQRSYGPKHMFRRAQSMANESGKTAYVVYDLSDNSYHAQTSYDPEGEDDFCELIAEVQPKKRK